MSAPSEELKKVGRGAASGQYVAHLVDDLRGYGRVLRALLLQEEDSRRRAPFEAILVLMEPIVLVGTISLFRYFFERASGSSASSPLGGSILLFYASGFYLKYLFIYISLKKIQGAAGTPRKRFPIERRLDGLIVHVLLRLIDWILLGFVVSGVLYWYGIVDAIPRDLVIVAKAFVAVTALGFGFGIFNMVMRRFFWFWHFLSMGINRALIILSGCLFVPDFLPPGPRYWISFNPEMHAIALFRTAFYPHYPTTLLDTTYLTYCAIGAVLLGLALERVTRRFEH